MAKNPGKHTPGPWKVQRCDGNVVIFAADGALVTSPFCANSAEDAKLIAAAPRAAGQTARPHRVCRVLASR